MTDLNKLMDHFSHAINECSKTEDVESFVLIYDKKTGDVASSGYGCRGCATEVILESIDRFTHTDGKPVRFIVAEISTLAEILAKDILAKVPEVVKEMKES